MSEERKTEGRVYFDWAATAGGGGEEDGGANAAEGPFANPSSIHTEGRRARTALEEARRQCAGALGVAPQTLYWTSGGSESNAIPIYARLLAARGGGGAARLAASAAEHPSVLRPLETLARLGLSVHTLALTPLGFIDEEALGRACAAGGLAFVSLPCVSNETGCIQPLTRLVRRVRAESARPVHIHSDCVQALGKLPLNLDECGVDSAAFSAHKIGGPRGTGLLYLRKPLEALVKGGGQEGGVRPGTENVAGARAFARRIARYAAPEAAAAFYEAAARRMNALTGALSAMERCRILPPERPLHAEGGGECAGLLLRGGWSPYIAAAAFRDIPGEALVRALDTAGFAVSAGSACSSAAKKKNALEDLGIDPKTAREAIRISQGWTTTTGDIERLAAAIRRICEKL